jgi:hypothetical protein
MSTRRQLPKLTDQQLRIADRMRDKQITWSVISYVLERPESTCRLAVANYKEKQSLPPKHIVYKRKITPAIGHLIRSFARENSKISLMAIRNKLVGCVDPGSFIPSKSGIRKYLLNSKFMCRRLRKAPLIQKRHELERRLHALFWLKVHFY